MRVTVEGVTAGLVVGQDHALGAELGQVLALLDAAVAAAVAEDDLARRSCRRGTNRRPRCRRAGRTAGCCRRPASTSGKESSVGPDRPAPAMSGSVALSVATMSVTVATYLRSCVVAPTVVIHGTSPGLPSGGGSRAVVAGRGGHVDAGGARVEEAHCVEVGPRVRRGAGADRVVDDVDVVDDRLLDGGDDRGSPGTRRRRRRSR